MIPFPRRVETRVLPLLVLALLLCGWLTLPLASQPQDERARETVLDQVEVRLVEIDVQVTDGDDRRVKGLEKDDFRLLVDGEEREIEHFVALREDDGAPETETAAPRNASGESGEGSRPGLPRLEPEEVAAARHLVIYVDQSFLEPAELDRARLELQRFLLDDVPADTSMMLVAADESLRVLQPFTGEPALVADAVDSLELSSGRGGWRQQYDLALQEIQKLHDLGRTAREGVAPRSLTEWMDGRYINKEPTNQADDSERWMNQGEDVGRAELAQSDPRIVVRMIEDLDRRVEPAVAGSVSRLAQMLRGMSGLEGEKTLLYVGGTLPSNAAQTLFETWQDTYASLADQVDAVGLEARRSLWTEGVRGEGLAGSQRFGEPSRLVDRVAQMANSADVTIHSLDVAVQGRLGRSLGDVENVRSGADMGGVVSSDTRLARRQDSGIHILAERTGGRSEYKRRFEEFLDGVARDLNGRYVLAFRAEVPAAGVAGDESDDGDDGLREIEVELRDAQGKAGKYRLHHRRAVAVKSLEQETTEQTLSALAMNLSPANPLEIAVAAGEPQSREDGGDTLPLSVKVPLARLALVPDQQSHAGRLSIYVAVGNLGSEVAMARSEVPVRIPNRDLLTAFGRTVDYRLQVAAPPGAERVAVTVRDEYRPSDSTVTAAIGSLVAEPPSAPASTEGGL